MEEDMGPGEAKAASLTAAAGDDFESLTRRVISFRDERDWAQFHTTKNLVMGLGIEVAELAELVQWKRDDEVLALRADPVFRQRVMEELADVQVYLLYLAENLGVSLPESVRMKLELNAEKYPADKVYGCAKKYNER